MRTADDIHDEWLVLRCQDGDSAALAELVDRWQPRLLRHVLRSTGYADDAADIVQAAWLAIVQGLHRLDDPACFRRWAYRVATHKCADWVRARQRDRGQAGALPVEVIDDRSMEHGHQDEIDRLRAALNRLPPERKAMLSMFYLEAMSLQEIAEALSRPVGTIKSRLYYARQELKQTLERIQP